MTASERLEMVNAELGILLKGIGRSPKSYTLWHHRQWIIKLGLKDETH